MGVELILASGETDGRTDMTKLIGASHEYANASNNSVIPICLCIGGAEVQLHYFRTHL